MISVYDYIVIIFYFLFIISLGFVFKKFNKGSKDYFAGGQRMCWWLLGGSLFISNFSCWTFTGAAGIAYKYGILILYVYVMDVAGYIIGYAFFATRLRQMRLITPIDGVRRRYGKISEQFFNWLSIFSAPLAGGAWLLSLALILTTVFCRPDQLVTKPEAVKAAALIAFIDSQNLKGKAVGQDKRVKESITIYQAIRKTFEQHHAISPKQWGNLLKSSLVFEKYLDGLNQNAANNGYLDELNRARDAQKKMASRKNWIIILTGITVLIMALLGGSWAVAASDFIQLLLLMTISVTTAVLALIKVGGITAFFNQLPEHFFNIFYPLGSIKYDWLFLASTVIGSILLRNNMMTAGKYISAKDSEHARKSTLIPLIGYALLPPLWFIPVWAAPTLLPNLISDFTGIVSHPEEMSYIAIAMKLLPQGLLGLLIVGLFAATMSSLDSAFNRNAGLIVCNFYRDILRPEASDRELFAAGQLATVFSGSCVIAVALLLANFGNISIFDTYLYFGAFVGSGPAVIFLLGMFMKRTPPWSAWVTVVFSIAISYLLFGYLRQDSTAAWLRPMLKGTSMLSIYDYVRSNPFFIPNLIVTPLCFLFFYLTGFFYKKEKLSGFSESVDKLFKDMNTPVNFNEEIGAENDNSKQQAVILGTLSVIYGAFIFLLLFVPNNLSGKIAIFSCSFVMLLIGALLIGSQRHQKQHNKRIDLPSLEVEPLE